VLEGALLSGQVSAGKTERAEIAPHMKVAAVVRVADARARARVRSCAATATRTRGDGVSRAACESVSVPTSRALAVVE
jgi:hypothetical protein